MTRLAGWWTGHVQMTVEIITEVDVLRPDYQGLTASALVTEQ
ncbi:MAG: hypothetical protein VYD11_07845 [Actinomycetota bacterium]|nr:hypothetical protein [Actinomycetota bacterium]MED5221531.1 hypothetical protein [Actinomycetota bacterium]MED5233085.1 hypothetical protein [Actinomycetota bacterium]MED5394937.1 hypothetical protein [Actinomycetota bacterium]MEE3352962.1 hypothetical protein [Actinomycetota bacterium]